MNSPSAPETDLQPLLTDIMSSWSDLKALPASLKSLQDQTATMAQQLTDTRRLLASRSRPSTLDGRHSPGRVSDDCAQHIISTFIAHYARRGRLEAINCLPVQRDALVDTACKTLGISTRAALTTTEIPLPTEYAGEIRELISQFGVVRRHMSPYPIGMGTAKPARMGTRPAFASIAMSAAFPEKVPSITFASLESHKVGGIVKIPREIDEQSIVSMGQYLARYGAIEFARLEDNWGFMADGTAQFDGIHGIVQVARDNTGRTLSLPAGKTKPSDATLSDFRAVRTKVNKAALSGRLSAYYLDSTWEAALPGFRSASEPNVYQRLPDGSAVLDGYPVIWTDVLEPYGTAASQDKPIAVFGALSFWWFGEHGRPRMDTSDDVFFANDQLGVRFIEEIDFDYAASDATAALLTAAS